MLWSGWLSIALASVYRITNTGRVKPRWLLGAVTFLHLKVICAVFQVFIYPGASLSLLLLSLRTSIGIFKDPDNHDTDNCHQNWSEEKHGLKAEPEGVRTPTRAFILFPRASLRDPVCS